MDATCVRETDVYDQDATTHSSQSDVNVAEQFKKLVSPQINGIEWGCVDVEDIGCIKDVKLYPGPEESNWSKTNTYHQPGIQPDDIMGLLSYGAEYHYLITWNG
ncbi:unnamed protein product [Rotaria sp. Silwood2]|nr:unnamed protein product [Rotaria sp. Silwood2]CAF4222537.1 unnamed protein product [Rotaria sp. Silwood2]